MKPDLYATWTRLGVFFANTPTREKNIDLELTLIKTSSECRKDSRLAFGMYGWLLKHHELVNTARLIRFIKDESSSAVMGAILESVVEHHPRSNLKYVLKYCRAQPAEEFVFERIAASKLLSAKNRDENLTIWKKWNLISNEMDDLKGAVQNKAYVLKHNPTLAIRALFGANLRSEILNYFVFNKSGNAHQIAASMNLSYEPVYKELDFFNRIGLLKDLRQGRNHLYHLRTSFLKQALLPLL